MKRGSNHDLRGDGSTFLVQTGERDVEKDRTPAKRACAIITHWIESKVLSSRLRHECIDIHGVAKRPPATHTIN